MSGVIMHQGPGGLSDGSWTLTVFVTDLQVERSLRVRGDLHIGGVMIRLVDELGKKKKMYSFDTLPTTLHSNVLWGMEFLVWDAKLVRFLHKNQHSHRKF